MGQEIWYMVHVKGIYQIYTCTIVGQGIERSKFRIKN